MNADLCVLSIFLLSVIGDKMLLLSFDVHDDL